MNPLELAVGQPWMARLGWTLVHFLWQGTVIAAAYGASLGFGGRLLSPRARYALACAALAMMATAPLITFLVSGSATAAAPVSSGIAGLAWERVLLWLVVIWAAGVALFSARLIGGWRVVARMRRVAVSAPPKEWQEALAALAAGMRVSPPVRLLASALTSTPTVVGWLRPVILVPVEALTGMPVEQMRALLAHELAHILRRDYLVNILQSIAEAVLFYHPAIWWISARIRAEREACCDDLAVAATGDVLVYATALADLDSRRRARMLLATAADGGSLAYRIRRLLGQAEPPTHALPSPGTVWALSLLWMAGLGAVLAHGTNSRAETSLSRVFVPPAVTASAAPIQFEVPPPIRAAPSTLAAALLFDPFFARPQGPPQQTASLSGVVLSSSGTPVAMASAELSPAPPQANTATGPQPRRQVVVTGASGTFSFENVAPGTYRFSVSHNVYLHPIHLKPKIEAFGPLPPSRMTFTAGQRVENITVRLLEPASITGNTVDEDGDPVARVSVQVLRRAYSEGRRHGEVVSLATSGDNGEFKLGGLAPGRYILKADRPPLWVSNPTFVSMFGARPARTDPGRAPIPAGKPGTKIYNPASAYYGGSITAAEATPIDVMPGQNISIGSVTMANRPVLRVRGTVVGDPGLLRGARVTQIQSDDPGLLPSRWEHGADIHKDGSFEIANVRPATGMVIGVENQKLGVLAWTRITVGQEDVEGVVLNASVAPMNGSVRFEADPPPDARSARLWISPALMGARFLNKTTTLNDDGSFVIPNMPLGSYTISANLPQGSYLKSVRVNGRELAEQVIDWRGPESGLLELMVSRNAPVIEGTLLDDDGKPAAGTVTLVPDPPRLAKGRWYPAVTADAQGHFRFLALTPGRYKLYGWEEIEETAHWDPDFIRPFESRGQTVEVTEGGRATVTTKRISAPNMRDVLSKAGLH